MGFAASQARFLSLTARLSDNEYQAQQICQERLALSDIMDLYSDEYNKAISNEGLFVNVYDPAQNVNSKKALTYETATNSPEDGGLGLNIVTNSGLLVVPDEETMQKKMNELNELAEVTGSGRMYSEGDFLVFKDVKNPSIFETNVEEGNFYFAYGISDATGEWDKKGYEQLDNIRKEYDTTDDAKAKAEYDTRIKKAEKQDTMLEMQLERLETEHKAIQTEMESVQKVVESNIESSYKTFG